MEAVESVLFNLLFLLSISVELHGIHVGEKDLRYSSLRDQHVIVLDNSERYRRQAPIVSNPLPSQNISQTEGTTLVAANTARNEVNRATSVPLPTTSTPPTIVINDTHEYYTLTIMQNQADNYWVELSNATLHQELRNTSKKAQTIQFQNSSFLFYGHSIYNVTITTGGFLYMSPYVHTFLTATQYTAPLMADFGTMGNNSDIYFQEYANQFIVEWRNVYLIDQGDFGPFKFQTILYKNGSIAFIYQKVPVAISSISTLNHPVKIGLADAFYIDAKNMRGQIIRTIYNYHTIKVNFTTVKPKTVIILHPLTSCNIAKDCYTCVTQKTAFKCLWCAKVQRCSDSFDWYRQEWLESGCQVEGHNSTDLCNGTTSKPALNATTTTRPSTTETPGPSNKTLSIKTHSTPTPSPVAPCNKTKDGSCGQGTQPITQNHVALASGSSKASMIAMIVVLGLFIVLGSLIAFLVYAYRNPTSALGQWLIQNRPCALRERIKNVRDNFFKCFSDSSEKYRLESESEL